FIEVRCPPTAHSLPAPTRRFRHIPLRGQLRKSSRFHRREEYGPADVAVELNSTEAAEAARPCASALPEKRRSGVKMRSVAEWQRTDSCPQQTASLFDHLVGAGAQCGGKRKRQSRQSISCAEFAVVSA